jgi:hypothetical protein
MLESPKELGSPVPQCYDFVGKNILKADFPAESKISELDLSLIVEEDVCRFDVSVEYFVGVEVGDSLDELLEDALDFGDSEFALHFKESCEVVIHILKD